MTGMRPFAFRGRRRGRSLVVAGVVFGRPRRRDRRIARPRATASTRRRSPRSRTTTSSRSTPLHRPPSADRTRSSTARSTACCGRSIRTRPSSTRSDYAQMRERQEGHYYGIGITISVGRRRHHRDVALRRIAGVSRRASAAATSSRAVERPRTPRAGRTDDVVAKLKGPKGTTVNISIRRPGRRRPDRPDRRARRRSTFRPCARRS